MDYLNLGTDKSSKDEQTERSVARKREDENYVPVIIKRNDESKVHPDDILERAIHEGLEQMDRPFNSLLLSSVAAGLILGFAAMAVAVVAAALPQEVPALVRRLAMAVVYPFGFIICIMSGTQLFTEHTATAVYPVLDRKAKPRKLLKLWFTVICGNLLGTFLSSLLIVQTESIIHAQSGYLQIAEHLTHNGFYSLFLSAILAGLLMAQGAWLVFATPPQSSQILCIYVVTFLIGVGGLHHSIAGSAEIFVATMMFKSVTLFDTFYFVSTALLGNLVGGSVFVAVLNYAHIRKMNTNG